MSRAVTLLIALGMALIWAVVPVQAQSPFPPDPQAWTGGNGWCEGGVCFRAWAGPDGIEVSWVVNSVSAPSLTVLRRQIQPSIDLAQPLIQSACSETKCPGQFIYEDTAVERGAIYQYTLVQTDGSEVMGEPLEAGLSVTAVDPGGDSGHRVYLPITLAWGR